MRRFFFGFVSTVCLVAATPACSSDSGSGQSGGDGGMTGGGASSTAGGSGASGSGGSGASSSGATGTGGSGAGGSSTGGSGNAGAAGNAGSGGVSGGTAGTVGTGGTARGGTATGGTGTGGTASGGTATGGTASGGTASGGTGGTTTAGACLVDGILSRLGKSSVMVGAAMGDTSATSAPFDLRYQYLSGGVFDGTSPCTSCASGCTAAGSSCANSAGCGWWGCWQYDQDPPGAFVRDFVSTAEGNGQIPMFTYYEILQTSGAGEGAPEVGAANDASVMTRYLADWAFVLDQIGQSVAFLHIEPDFWGYAEQVNSDPHQIPAAVASASSECSGFEDSIAGLGQCMIAMVRSHAPNALVGLHASGWGTNYDVLLNGNASFDVVGEAQKLGAFLAACGAGDGDFIVVDPSDRDAAWYDTQGQSRWWDDTNATLPNFTQAFTWTKALGDSLSLPVMWWQVPVGNMALDNTTNRYQDNRLDYFFDHMDELAAANGFAIAYGAGDGAQTTPETDDGHLISRMQTYATSGGQAPCP